ncbi:MULTISPECIES: hypothetical protein [unclassified Helicobacter]|uniref:hypothetical protein n=1 Tax=unclassified Helicobacter TaxID=2593540 RepID=UPI000CF0FD23|nr:MULTISPECIES: hypothetical protein [unclassified Helicobacter]
MKAYGMVYALLLLLAVTFSSQIVLKYFGASLDVGSNFYGSLQNEIYMKNVYEIAKKCLEKYDFNLCWEDEMVFDHFSASYRLFEQEDSYKIEIVLLHKNPRNLHIIRSFTNKIIKKQDARFINPV